MYLCMLVGLCILLSLGKFTCKLTIKVIVYMNICNKAQNFDSSNYDLQTNINSTINHIKI